MEYIEALNQYDGDENSVFLAGGITGCPDWQSEMVEKLKDTKLVIFNPRRKDFPIHDPNAAREQTKWEHAYLRESTMISFWFPCETICPIVLYELGAWSMTAMTYRFKKLFIGVHPDYKRRQDVEIQTSLARPEIIISYSLDELIDSIKGWVQ